VSTNTVRTNVPAENVPAPVPAENVPAVPAENVPTMTLPSALASMVVKLQAAGEYRVTSREQEATMVVKGLSDAVTRGQSAYLGRSGRCIIVKLSAPSDSKLPWVMFSLTVKGTAVTAAYLGSYGSSNGALNAHRAADVRTGYIGTVPAAAVSA
jgi:hypothetical protein